MFNLGLSGVIYLQAAAIPGNIKAAIMGRKPGEGVGSALLTGKESGQQSRPARAVDNDSLGEACEEQRIGGMQGRAEAKSRSAVSGPAFRGDGRGFEPVSTLSDPRHSRI
jgi:hypothetical protein